MPKAALCTFVLVLALSVAHAQGPECKHGPNPPILAIQQNCAKGSLLCKELQVFPASLSYVATFTMAAG